MLDRIDRKIQRAARAVPAPVVRTAAGATLGLIDGGRLPRARASKRSTCSAKDGVALDYMRVRGFPFGDEVARFLDVARAWCSSSSRTATRQLRSLLDARDAACAEANGSSRCATTAASR